MPDELGHFSDLVTSVTIRNLSSLKIGYGENADNTDVSASRESHVTNVTTFFEKQASQPTEVATSVERFVDEIDLENEGYNFEESMVTPETKTASLLEL